MRRCVLVLVCLLVAVGVTSCKKKSPSPSAAHAPDARVADAMPSVADPEALAPASVALPTVVARIAADGTVTGLPPLEVDAGVAADTDEDDGPEESGGTGSLVNLDETRLAAAVRQVDPRTQRYLDASWPPGPARGVPANVPQRQGRALGETLDEPLPASLPPLLVAAHPSARATALVDLLAVRPALLAVSHQGTTRALRVGFAAHDAQPWSVWSRWLEVRVTGDQIFVEGVPGMAKLHDGPVDAAALADAWRTQREGNALSDRLDVDVLVDDRVDVQRLVDVLAALDRAGARLFSVGRLPAPDSDELKKRGGPIRFVQFGPLQAVGAIDKKVIEAALIAAHPAFLTCWDQALTRDPKARGVVTVQFFIAPTGAVGDSRGAGVDVDLSTCMAKVIRGLALPKPSGGGGAQVQATFRMWK